MYLSPLRPPAVKSEWSQVVTGHMYPAPRFGHSMVCVPPVCMVAESGSLVDGGGSLMDSGGSPALTSSPVHLLLFGGMNSMYCANDLWRLRVRRRRTRFALPGYGPEGSGSDEEDWVSSGDEGVEEGGVQGSRPGHAAGALAGAEATMDARALVAWSSKGKGAGAGAGKAASGGSAWGSAGGGRVGSEEGAGSEWQAILTDMQEQLLDLKMQLSVAQQRYAVHSSCLTVPGMCLLCGAVPGPCFATVPACFRLLLLVAQVRWGACDT